MSAAALLPDAADPPRRPDPPPWVEFARAPLVPVALAATVGLVADRYLTVPLDAALAVAVVGLVGFAARSLRGRVAPGAALPLLWVTFAGLAAARHHTHRHSFDPDDVGEFAQLEPALVRVRGALAEEPVARFAAKSDPLEPVNRPGRDSAVLRVTALSARDGWRPASGLARLSADRPPDSIGRPALGGLRA
ncbi:MAG TPA: hypothetical protein VFG68_13860, partial [Fimbriiglobus sp.]|nr:hypothetical protein [Fimbriiglobus sp.]